MNSNSNKENIFVDSEFTDDVEQFFEAVSDNDLEKSRDCFQRNRSCLKAIDPEGNNIFHIAAGCGSDTALEWLIDVCNAESINSTNNEGNTPLHSAVYGGNVGTMKILYKADSSKYDARNKSGQTVYYILKKSYPELLLEWDAFIKETDAAAYPHFITLASAASKAK